MVDEIAASVRFLLTLLIVLVHDPPRTHPFTQQKQIVLIESKRDYFHTPLECSTYLKKILVHRPDLRHTHGVEAVSLFSLFFRVAFYISSICTSF